MAGRLCLVVVFLLLTGCGYVGPVLPPSPELPQTITDLSVVERGNQLVIVFNTPARTTDTLPIPRFSHVDLRIGTYAVPFDFDRWASAATPIEVQPPPAADITNPLAVSLTQTLPVSAWVGKRVAVAVRTSVKRNDHFSAWSNRVVIEVVPPLIAPLIDVKSTPKGILVSWRPSAGATEYRVSRAGPNEGNALDLGTSKTDEYLDETSQYDTPYVYTVVAAHGSAESVAAHSQSITAIDKFAPSVPTGLTALAGPNTIEVSWQRSPETDLKGYHMYRSIDKGAFQQIGGLLTVPNYSDNNVQHGHTYRYQVDAIDQKNNVSARSVTAEAAF